ncbi:NAD-dependent epimerase/dehydratase family protein [Legionella drancourtii]|uniref:NAD-dependent epimerase/dehydratase domain-containing protein n=1 Tax=Legionella drancourtii LLAP12 TaxID=658187 RepID=G9EIT2_9GAMM|nr:GDP-mannose 4,6-dehydratase [Legionella drancourtii]EHL32850.1 hypothetical protein LDG_5088 [Legionella drancourtii LLAP12]
MQTQTSPRVLITGSHGFTGRYMAQEMQQAGYQVYGLGSSPSKDEHYFQADLCNPLAVKTVLDAVQPDYVIHLAALAFVAHSDANAFYQINVQGTRNLLAGLAAMQLPVKGVLLASSANVYGNVAEGVQDEDTRPNPANDYAVSKLAMEYMAKLWMTKLPIIITRPFNYTGVGQAEQFFLPKIISHFRRKEASIELGNIDVWRDFSDVRVVVSAYRRLLEHNAFGHIVNVCSGKTHSLREIIDYCRQVTQHQIEIRVNPAFVRTNEVKTLCGNNFKLFDLIGDLPGKTLHETLHWMIEA